MPDYSILDSLIAREDIWFWIGTASLSVFVLSTFFSWMNTEKKIAYIASNGAYFHQSGHPQIVRSPFWKDVWFWVGISALAMVGASEAISHRYALRKDEIVLELRDKFENDQKREIPDLKSDLAKSEKEVIQLKIDLEQAELKFAEASRQARPAATRLDVVRSAARDDKASSPKKHQ